MPNFRPFIWRSERSKQAGTDVADWIQLYLLAFVTCTQLPRVCEICRMFSMCVCRSLNMSVQDTSHVQGNERRLASKRGLPRIRPEERKPNLGAVFHSLSMASGTSFSLCFYGVTNLILLLTGVKRKQKQRRHLLEHKTSKTHVSKLLVIGALGPSTASSIKCGFLHYS